MASGIAHEINSPSNSPMIIFFPQDTVDGFMPKLKEKKAPDKKELNFLTENAPEAVTQPFEGLRLLPS